MTSINRVQLLGHLGADPTIQAFRDGGRIATFNLATTEAWTSKQSGERQEKTNWSRVVINAEGLVKLAESYLKKGSRVYLEGKLESRSFERDGQTEYVTEVVLRPFHGEIVLLDQRRDAAPEPERANPPQRRQRGQTADR